LLSRLVVAPARIGTGLADLDKQKTDQGCQGSSILYVEDDRQTFLLLKSAFDALGESFNISHAFDGDEAIQLLGRTGVYRDATRPDAIVLDLRLPKKDGLEVLADIRGCESFCDIPVVVFTSFPRSQERKKAFELGARGYLAKPSSIDGFMAVAEMIRALIK
jgi:CheY-like chemotaxis protein